MPYRYAVDRPDYSDFAAGPVLYSLPGRPAFPVRLTSEIFQRCQAQLRRAGRAGPYRVYDPCCGSGYLLTTLAFLHWPALADVAGSDVDPDAVALAERNLSLLTLAGVEARRAQLAGLADAYGRPAHAEAAASAGRLRALLERHLQLRGLACRAFVADALGDDPRRDIAPASVDVVITDVPYGQRTSWQATEPSDDTPEWLLLERLRPLLAPDAVVALTSTKGQRAAHAAYRRLEQLQVGKRRTLFFAPLA